MVWLWFAVGLTALVAGAELLVRGAAGLAAALRVSPLVIGLTIVAYGTSSPELVVSAQAALTDHPDMAVGNVIGSNIFNVLVILGLSAVIVPLRVHQKVVRLDVPLLIGASLVVFLAARDGAIDRLEAGGLLVGLVAYTAWAMRACRQERDDVVIAEYAAEFPGRCDLGSGAVILSVAMLAGGIGLLAVGAGRVVDSAASIARAMGVSESVIGLTLVAAGTSLPELVASVAAAMRGRRDIAVANVVGSGIFNLLGVLAVAALARPDGVPVEPAVIAWELPVMVLVAFGCLPVFFVGQVIQRWEGVLLLEFYALYVFNHVFQVHGSPRMLAAVQQGTWILVPLAVAAYLCPVLGPCSRRGGTPAGR